MESGATDSDADGSNRQRGVGVRVGFRGGGGVGVGVGVGVEGDGVNRQRWRAVGVEFRWKRGTTSRRGERESRADVPRGRRRSVGGIGVKVGGDGSNQRRRRGSTFLLQQPRLRAFRCVGVSLGGRRSPTLKGAQKGLLLLSVLHLRSRERRNELRSEASEHRSRGDRNVVRRRRQGNGRLMHGGVATSAGREKFSDSNFREENEMERTEERTGLLFPKENKSLSRNKCSDRRESMQARRREG